MKKSVRFLSAVFAAVLLGLCAVGCGSSKPVVGIIQFGSHASLNNCYEGVMAGLKEAGITEDNYQFEYVNSNFDASVSLTQANTLVNKKAAVIVAIATPSAVAVANAAADGDMPAVYCAVTDASVMKNYPNMTGSTDIPDFGRQLEVVTAVMGRTDLKIGVLYSTEESSSPVQVANLKAAAGAYAGMTVEDSAVADINTIDAKTKELLSRGVDCLINILDNTVVGKLETNILPLTDEARVPVFGSEIEQVKVGCAASASIDYVDVGKAAGQAAAKILQGTSVEDIPAVSITEPHNYYNSRVCAKLGLTVPGDMGLQDVAG